jgi:chromosome segregation ATPase
MSTTRDRDKLKRQVTALERDLEAAAAQARDAEEVLERLEASQSEAAGRLTLASRAKADLEQRLAQLHGALQDAEREAAEQAYREALAARDRAAEEAATAIDRAITAVENLDKARVAAKRAWEDAAKGGAKLSDASPAEPAAYAEQWSRLEKLVRQKAQLQLEKDLVEAAAVSPMGNAIKDLPVHLQQLARKRRSALHRAT